MTEHAISRWPSVEDLTKKFDALISRPIVRLKKEAKAKYLEHFNTKCEKSKELTTEAKQYIPGSVQHNLSFNHPFPLVMKKADGAFLWDIDGNKYVDFLAAGGPTLLGSNYKPVREKIIDLINECGPVTGLFHEYELKLAKLVCKHFPSVEMLRMLGSGTEAAMAAIRLARTFTGNRRIIKVGGAYHGWSDQLVYGLHVPGTGRLEAIGIPAGCSKDTQEFNPNDIDKLRKLLEKNEGKKGTAGVLLEPLGPESGTRPVRRDFNEQVRELCDDFGALLIFDEVVTGFRVGMGGAQGFFDITPDITIFGKAITGTYPAAGGLGGRHEIMELLAAGVESGKQKCYVGGTLSANPISCAAGYFSILELEKTNAPVIAGKMGDRLCDGLKDINERYNLPYVAWNHGSIVHLETSGPMLMDVTHPKALDEKQGVLPRKEAMEEFGMGLMAEGIISIGASRFYTTLAHTKEIIDDAIQSFENVMKNSQAAE
ncbi:aminotransferase class III-fold pyridoxal phosphate-dependent enzyme [Candidatus Bathyarchaeota archaeon]|nr:aminotransferase class III-fold pyridoxal phosphate-dependent enzyme [Candidatus Bathyarchaeota archaeon]